MMTQPDSRSPDPSNGVVTWRAVDLSNDHKPDRPDERRRIALTGGRVAPSRGKHGEAEGPARVWLPDQEYPGLAMSRAMGDLAARPAGIICAPDSSRVNLKSLLVRGKERGGGHKVRDQAASIFSGIVGRKNPLAGMEGGIRPGRCFVVLASDGVTEFMSSQEVVDLVAKRLVWTRVPGSYPQEEEEAKDIWQGHASVQSSSSSLAFPSSWGAIFGGHGQKQAQGLQPLSASTGVTGAQADAACEEACRAVVRESLARWKKEYGGRYIDDITVCIAQLESL